MPWRKMDNSFSKMIYLSKMINFLGKCQWILNPALPHLYFTATTEKVSVSRLQSDTWLCVRVLRVFLLLVLSVIVFMVPLTFSLFPPLSLHILFSPAVLIVSSVGNRERTNWSTCMSLVYFSTALVTHFLSTLLHTPLRRAKNPSADGP